MEVSIKLPSHLVKLFEGWYDKERRLNTFKGSFTEFLSSTVNRFFLNSSNFDFFLDECESEGIPIDWEEE